MGVDRKPKLDEDGTLYTGVLIRLVTALVRELPAAP
jgi:hypothetical protein